jgi:hypothetical protein
MARTKRGDKKGEAKLQKGLRVKWNFTLKKKKNYYY